MTDKEKAKELASLLVGEDQNQEPLVEILMEMAQWKEQQMMKDAITIKVGNEWGHPRYELDRYILEPLGIKSRDIVKLIIIKED